MGEHPQRAGGLALDDDGLLAVGGRARRPRSTGRRHSPRSARCARSRRRATPRRRRAAARPRRSPPCACASARRTPSARMSPPFMSTVPEPIRWSPSRASGRGRRARGRCRRGRAARSCPLPLPRRVTIRSSAWPGDEHGARSTRAASGASVDGERERRLGALDVARRRGDRDEPLELLRARAPRSRRRRRRSRDPSARSTACERAQPFGAVLVARALPSPHPARARRRGHDGGRGRRLRRRRGAGAGGGGRGRRAIAALRPVAGSQRVEAKLAPPRYPLYHLDQLRRVRGAYARLGTLRAVRDALRISVSAVRFELRLARGFGAARLRAARSAVPGLREVKRARVRQLRGNATLQAACELEPPRGATP